MTTLAREPVHPLAPARDQLGGRQVTRFVTIPAASAETGVHEATIRRWIASGMMKKSTHGLVNLRTVERLKKRPRVGRPCGLSELERIYLVRDARALASPFLNGERGLAMFAAAAQIVAEAQRNSPKQRDAFRELLDRLYASC